jgi:hypothetical protein
VILSLPVEGEFCFAPIRGRHWTASARAYHWKALRAAAGWEGSLYLATRHFAGWYMVNVLELPSEDVAIALGHTDGGELVRKLYGAPRPGARARSRDRCVRADGELHADAYSPRVWPGRSDAGASLLRALAALRNGGDGPIAVAACVIRS